MSRVLAAVGVLVAAVLVSTCASAQSRFDGWAAAIVAGDWRDGAGQPIQAFDNARRDLTAGFLAAGFSRADMVDVTLRPDVDRPVTAPEALADITAVTARAPGGCLLYFTSHGSPQGLTFGPDGLIEPATMANLVRGWCGSRPTVLIVSACYSGVFVEGLAAPNRMILTAASRDRTSFGCGAEETYPWFDGCVLESLPSATDFLALAAATRACVRRREEEIGLKPSSDPQLFVGADMQLRLPTLRFSRPAG